MVRAFACVVVVAIGCGGRMESTTNVVACVTPVATIDCAEEDFVALDNDALDDAGSRTGTMRSCRTGCATSTLCEVLVSGYGFVDGVCE